MTLKELMHKANWPFLRPLILQRPDWEPARPGGTIKTFRVEAIHGMTCDEAKLIVHAVNMLPRLVEALERAVSIIEDLPFPEDAPAKDFEKLLHEANNPKHHE